MIERWYASDHHLSHYNIIAYGDRPFKDEREMNEALRTYHNETVKSHHHVTFLGDVTLRRGGKADRDWFVAEMRKYHGHKRLHLGNHDHYPIKVYLEAGFEKIYATWRDEDGLLYSHFPVHPTSIGSAKANVHGHIHQNKSPDPVIWVDKDQRIRSKHYINVCVEAINYRPIHHDELLARVTKLQGEWEGVKT